MTEVLLSKITDVRSVVSSSKSCTFNNGCVLESKFGYVVFDFSNQNISKVVLHFKRLSGNGKIIVRGSEATITSKTLQDLEFSQRVIEIRRPLTGTGEISIFAVSLYGYNSEKENTLTKNWKKIVNRFGDYRCLQMIGEKLFASEGAYISNGKAVELIETSPPNMTKLLNDKLIFLGACEIISLIIGELDVPNYLPDIYVQRQAPTPIIVPTERAINIHAPTPQPKLSQPRKLVKKTMQQFIYDSDSVNEFTTVNKNNTKTVKFVNSNGANYLILQKGGHYDISMPELNESNLQYIAVVTAKKLNGNGRLSVYIDSCKEEFVNVDGKPKEYAVILRPEEASSPYRLRLAAGQTSAGEILVSKVKVFKTDSAHNYITNNGIGYEYGVPLRPPNSGIIHQVRWVAEKRKFVIVIPSYKNLQWCERNILSTINQNYDQYRVVFTDDNSPDGTFDKVKKLVDQSDKKDKFTLIKNTVRLGALENLYNMIYSCEDDEIILTLDGDDWLANENVLNKLNEVYYNGDVWMTYGQYQNHPDGGKGIAQAIPTNITTANSYRDSTWRSSHLRTFCTWLFKNIRKDDLMYQGQFMSMTWDMAMMFPMLEMSGKRAKFIPDILYIYNLENPINDHKVNMQLQQNLDRYVRHLPRYSPLNSPSTKKPRFNKISVGLLFIATGKYHTFIHGLVSSADNYFLNEDNIDVHYYVFCDQDIKLDTKRKYTVIPIEHKTFPFASMDRFKHFTNNANVLSKENYLYYVDVDCLFVNYISTEIIGNLVGVRHCGYYKGGGPYENNPKSVFFVDATSSSKYKYYFGGGFSGGESSKYLEMSKRLHEMIDSDVTNGVMPLWHDETALNRYYLDNQPEVILDPSYHFPQDNIERYKAMWAPDSFRPKILLLSKNHKEIR